MVFGWGLKICKGRADSYICLLCCCCCCCRYPHDGDLMRLVKEELAIINQYGAIRIDNVPHHLCQVAEIERDVLLRPILQEYRHAKGDSGGFDAYSSPISYDDYLKRAMWFEDIIHKTLGLQKMAPHERQEATFQYFCQRVGPQEHRGSACSLFPAYANDIELLNLNWPKRCSPICGLPKHQSSLLNQFARQSELAGVTTSMAYVRTLLTTFCWHVEDLGMMSASFTIRGDDTEWFSIDASQFDKLFDMIAHMASESGDPKLFNHMAVAISPEELISKGFIITRGLQKARSIIITAKQAYHCGFSHGTNTALAVNFLLSSGLDSCRIMADRYKQIQRLPLFDWRRLLLSLSGRRGTPLDGNQLTAYEKIIADELLFLNSIGIER